MNDGAFYGHLGLGDHLITNGLVRDIAKNFDHLYVLVKSHNEPSVSFMYNDVQNVSVVSVDNDAEAQEWCNERWKELPIVYNGMHKRDGSFDMDRWDSCFYRQANVPFEQSWDGWKVPECASRPYPNKPFAFVHADERRGYTIDTSFMDRNLHIVSNEDARPDNIFAWTEVLRNATEIHCIESCFAILVDRLDGIKAKRLVLHAYARKSRPPVYRKNWEILR